VLWFALLTAFFMHQFSKQPVAQADPKSQSRPRRETAPTTQVTPPKLDTSERPGNPPPPYQPSTGSTSSRSAQVLDVQVVPSQTPVTASPPSRQEDSGDFLVSGVKVDGPSRFALQIHIEGKQVNEKFKIRDGASLVWVMQTAGVRRVDTPFTIPAGQRDFKITQPLSLDIGDRWPIEIYLAERWYTPQPGYKKLSNSMRVGEQDVDSNSFGPFGRPRIPSPRFGPDF
jgi:hypothetical protein